MMPGRSRFLKVRPSTLQGRALRPPFFVLPERRLFPTAEHRIGFHIALCTIPSLRYRVYLNLPKLQPLEPMLYWPDYLFMFRNHTFNLRFSRVGAQLAMKSGKMEFDTHSILGGEPAAQSLGDDLSCFSSMYKSPTAETLSFVAMFEQIGVIEAVPLRIDMQTRSNKRTQRNTAFAALLVWMLTLASGSMQMLGKPGAALN